MRKGVMLVWLWLAAPMSLVWGQVAPAAPADWQTKFFEAPAVALPLLVEATMQHAPALQAMAVERRIIQEDIQIARKSILGMVALGGNMSYGNLTGVSLPDPGQGNQFATSSSSRYSVGVNVSIPFDQVTSYKNRVTKERLQYERATSMQADREKVLREEVVRMYQAVLLARKVLTIQQEFFVTAQINHQLAEKQFQLGQVSLVELSQITNAYNQATITRETATSQYETAFLLLEEMIGTKISTLMASR